MAKKKYRLVITAGAVSLRKLKKAKYTRDLYIGIIFIIRKSLFLRLFAPFHDSELETHLKATPGNIKNRCYIRRMRVCLLSKDARSYMRIHNNYHYKCRVRKW